MLILNPLRMTFALITIGTNLSLFSPCAGAEPANIEAQKGMQIFSTPLEAAQSWLTDVQKVSKKIQLSVLNEKGVEQAKVSEYDALAKLWGFSSVEEVSRAHLGNPLKQFTISLDQIRQVQTKGDVLNVLNDVHSFIFPLLVEGTVKSSVTVAKAHSGKEWQVRNKGASKLINLINSQKPGSSSFVVIIPTLNVTFVGDIQGSTLSLTFLRDSRNTAMQFTDKEIIFKSGDKVNASNFLRQLRIPKEDPIQYLDVKTFNRGSISVSPPHSNNKQKE